MVLLEMSKEYNISRPSNGHLNTRKLPNSRLSSLPPSLPALNDKYKYTYSYAGKKGVIDIAEFYAITPNLSLTNISFDDNNNNMVDELIDNMIFNKEGKFQNKQPPGKTPYIIIGKDDNIIADTQFVTWNKYKSGDKEAQKPTSLLQDIYKNTENLVSVNLYGKYNKKWKIRCPGSEKYEKVTVDKYFVITREYKSDNGTIFNSNYSKFIKPVVSINVEFLKLDFKVQILGCVLDNGKIIPDMSYFEWEIDETDLEELLKKIEKDKEDKINEEKRLYDEQKVLENNVKEEKKRENQNRGNELLAQNLLIAQKEIDNNNKLQEEAKKESQIIDQGVFLLENAIQGEKTLEAIHESQRDIKKLEEKNRLELEKEKNNEKKKEIDTKFKEVLNELVTQKSTLEEQQEELNEKAKEIEGEVHNLLGTPLPLAPEAAPAEEAEPCKTYLAALTSQSGGRRNKRTRKMKRIKSRRKSRKVKRIKSRRRKF